MIPVLGIAAADLPNVFDRFWHGRRSAKIRSTGLGLAIARGIIEAHGGRIMVQSKLRETEARSGLTYRPRSSDPSAATSPHPVAVSGNPLQTESGSPTACSRWNAKVYGDAGPRGQCRGQRQGR